MAAYSQAPEIQQNLTRRNTQRNIVLKDEMGSLLSFSLKQYCVAYCAWLDFAVFLVVWEWTAALGTALLSIALTLL